MTFRMHMFTTPIIGVVCLTATICPGASGKAPRCASGRYAVEGTPLGTPGAQLASQVVVEEGRLTLLGLCAPTTAKLKATKMGTRVKAVAQGCQGFRKKAKVKALITSECQSMIGTLTGKDMSRKKVRQRFTAALVRDGSGGPTTTVPSGAPTTTSTVPPASFLRWATAAPVSVAPGQSFPLALEVNGNGRTCSGESARVQGTILHCLDGDCLDDAITVEPSTFDGPPGTFDFQGRRRAACSYVPQYSFTPEVYLADAQGNMTVGPFYGPTTSTEAPPPTPPTLSAGCGGSLEDGEEQTLYFGVLTGQAPAQHTVLFESGCGEEFAWTASVDVPWARVEPAMGTSFFECGEVTVIVDPALLPAGDVHSGTLTVDSPGAVGSPLIFPIEVTAVTASAQVTQPLPATLAPGQAAPFGIAISGAFEDVSGYLTLCPADDPDECDELLVEATPDFFSGPPGPFAFSMRRTEECVVEGDYVVAASLSFDDALGPFQLPLTTVRLPASAPNELLTDDEQLTFVALHGQPAPPSQTVHLYADCGAVGWTAVADRPWLTVTPTSAASADGDVATVAVNPAGLAASTTPYTGTVTFTPTDANVPLVVVSVAFHLRSDPTIQWTQTPPATAALGGEFPLALTVQASTPSVSGEVFVCEVGVPPERCTDEGPFSFQSYFQGPPGTFQFTVRREADCERGTSHYFVAQVFAEQGFEEIGPFVGPPTSSTVLTGPAQLTLFAYPEELEFNAYGMTNPPPQQIAVGELCETELAPTVTTSHPWLRAMATAGGVMVEIDVAGLDASQGPFRGTITVAAPNATSITVPVVLNLAC